MNIVIVGLGAVGSVYAVAMLENQVPVRVAVDADRLERYRRVPFMFNGVEKHFDYFTPDASSQKADLVIIATKWVGYKEALALIKPTVSRHTIILPLLNGISSEQLAIEAFGPENVLYGYFIGHTATRKGREAEQDGHYVTVFGDAQNDLQNLSSNVLKVKSLFDIVGVKYRIDPDMIASLWQKFIINIGLNQSTAFYRQPYGLVRDDEKALRFTRDLMDEAAAVAQCVGVKGAEEMVQLGIETLAKMRPQDSSSMLQDVEAERQTEVDMFAGEVCRLGQLHGVETPENRIIFEKFKK